MFSIAICEDVTILPSLEDDIETTVEGSSTSGMGYRDMVTQTSGMSMGPTEYVKSIGPTENVNNKWTPTTKRAHGMDTVLPKRR